MDLADEVSPGSFPVYSATAGTLDGQKAFKQLFSAGKWAVDINVSESRSAKRRALVIAATYGDRSPPPPLIGPYADAYKITGLLVEQFGYPEDEICVLADVPGRFGRENQARSPSLINIQKGLEWLCRGSRANDYRFLYFAGHGIRRTEINGISYEGILPTNVQFRLYQLCEECVCGANALAFITPTQERVMAHPETVIWGYQINNILASYLADGSMLTVVFDCSNSGGIFRNSLASYWEATIDPNVRGSSSQPAEPEARSGLPTPPLESPLGGNYLYLPEQLDLKVPDPSSMRAVAESGKSATAGRFPEAISNNSELACAPHTLSEIQIQGFAPNSRVLCWAACRDTEFATEDQRGGCFTHAFVERLKTRTRPTYQELNDHIQRWGSKMPRLQNPQLYTSANMRNSDDGKSKLQEVVDI